MVQTGRSSTSAARRARSRPRYAALSPRATGSAGSRGVRPAAATPTTFGTGRTAERRRSTTWCCCAAGITGRCTRRGSGSGSTQAVRQGSCGLAGRAAGPQVGDWHPVAAAAGHAHRAGDSRGRARRFRGNVRSVTTQGFRITGDPSGAVRFVRCQATSGIDPLVECAPVGGQFWMRGLTGDGSIRR